MIQYTVKTSVQYKYVKITCKFWIPFQFVLVRDSFVNPDSVTEIRQNNGRRFTSCKQDVFRFDIQVCDAVLVEITEGE